jgi:hypothetical protein
MSKESLVFFTGIVLILLPFLGIPAVWKTGFAVFLGVLLIFTGYRLRRDLYLAHIDKGNGERATDSFVETTDKLF